MRLHLLFAVVGLQILIFQFVSVRFLRAIPGYVLGNSQLPGDVEVAAASYRKDLGRWSYPIGAILLAAMTLCVYVFPFTSGIPGVLVLTAASILSSVFFAWIYLRARAAADKITEKLPDLAVRVASMERRTLGHYYNVAWELVPFVILAASAVLTLWALPKLGQPYPVHFGEQGMPDSWGEGVGRFVFILLIQGAFAFGLLLLTLRVLRSRTCASSKAPVAAGNPEEAHRLGERSGRRELQFFMAAKVAVALQFSLILVVRIETATGVNLPWWATNSPWALTGLLLALFLFYIVKTARGRD